MKAYCSASSLSSVSLAITLIVLMGSHACMAQLSPNFYDKTCPKALKTIEVAVRAAVSRERRMAASLVRLHFHDCFVQGCDASVLITNGGERNALQNANSIRGFGVVDDIKSRVESVCPGVVSCADILAVAARDASLAVGGPSWTVKLGRRDSTTAGSQSLAERDLPRGSDDLSTLQSLFSRKGFSSRELVALSGSHTIGLARCVTFRTRIYSNASNIDPEFARKRQTQCPPVNGNSSLAPLDLVTPNFFDNYYFKNLLQRKGLLTSDQVLFNGGSTDGIVTEYSKNGRIFNSDFAASMVKMGDLDPLTGRDGEIRLDCKVFN